MRYDCFAGRARSVRSVTLKGLPSRPQGDLRCPPFSCGTPGSSGTSGKSGTVGAGAETEMKEKKARVEDALHATRAAVEEGIVPGGGVALIRAQAALEGLDVSDEQRFGVNIVRRSIEEPLRQIAGNAGEEGSIVVQKVREGLGSFGYNAATNTYGDLIAMGVIDPAKVVRSALQNAASVASLMLTTEALIAERPKDEKASAGGGHAGHGHGDF